MKNYIKSFLMFSLVAIFMLPVLASAQTAADLQAQIQALLTQIQQLQAHLAQVQGNTVPAWCHTFNAGLGVGSNGDEVASLAIALEKEGLTVGKTDSYDESVASAVTGFQEKYRNEILAPAGLSNGTGYVGGRTRAKLNALYGCGVMPLEVTATQKVPAYPLPTSNAIPVAPTATQQQTTQTIQPTQAFSSQTSLLGQSSFVEQVKCVFEGSTSQQLCYTTNRDGKQFNFYTSNNTSALGTVSGRPYEVLIWKSSCGGYAFTVLGPRSDTVTFNCGATVLPSITVLSPNSGESWQAGSSHAISWRNNGPYKDVGAHLIRMSGSAVLTNGQEGLPLGTFSSVNNFTFSVPTEVVAADDYVIEIINYDSTIAGITGPRDISDGTFSITNPSPTYSQAAQPVEKTTSTYVPATSAGNVVPAITVVTPNGGEQFVTGKTYHITWSSQGVNQVWIGAQRYPDAIMSVPIGTVNIAKGITNKGSYDWTVPLDATPSPYYAIQVMDMNNSSVNDKSDTPLSIISTNPQALTVDVKINGSDTPASVPYDSPFTVSWTSNGAVSCRDLGQFIPAVDGGSWAQFVNLPTSGTKSLYARTGSQGYLATLDISVGCSNAAGQFLEDAVHLSVQPPTTSSSTSIAVPVTVESTLKPSVTVLVPNGGEGWQAGGRGKIAWTTTGIPSGDSIYTVRLRDSMGVEHDLLTNTPNDGFEEIAVPANLASGSYRLEIKTIAGGQTVSDQSDAPFTVTGPTSAVFSQSQMASTLESLKLILESLQALVQHL